MSLWIKGLEKLGQPRCYIFGSYKKKNSKLRKVLLFTTSEKKYPFPQIYVYLGSFYHPQCESNIQCIEKDRWGSLEITCRWNRTDRVNASEQGVGRHSAIWPEESLRLPTIGLKSCFKTERFSFCYDFLNKNAQKSECITGNWFSCPFLKAKGQESQTGSTTLLSKKESLVHGQDQNQNQKFIAVHLQGICLGHLCNNKPI